MKYCSHCKVYIRGDKLQCTLCENSLPETHEEEETLFPTVPLIFESHLALRITAFISIAALVVSFALKEIFPSNINSPLFVLLALVTMWLSLIVVIRKRHNIAKTIMWQVSLLSILSILWDWRIGWRGWSLDYVLPISYVAAMFVMYITAKIMRLSVRDYIVYLLLDGLFGIIPIVFVLFDWITVYYPSIICVAISIIFLSAILIFEGENIKIELDKRMHI